MDLSWLERGDCVKVKTSDSEIVGKILTVSDTFLVIVNDLGRKTGINADKIEYISQIDMAEVASSVTEPLEVKVPVIQKSEVNSVSQRTNSLREDTIDALYRSVVGRINKDSIDPAWTFEEAMDYYKQFKEEDSSSCQKYLSAMRSIEYSLKKDASSIDDKISSAIPKLRVVYENTNDDNIIEIIAFLHTLYSPKKKFKDSAFVDGYNYLLKTLGERDAMRYYLSNARLPEGLQLWNKYLLAPESLLIVIERDYEKSRKSNAILTGLIRDIFDFPMADNSSKMLIFYGVLRLFDAASPYSNRLKNDPMLLGELFDAIISKLESYSSKGTLVSIKNNCGTAVDDDFNIVYFDIPSTIRLDIGDIVEYQYNATNRKCSIIKLIRKDDEAKSNLHDFYRNSANSQSRDIRSLRSEVERYLQILSKPKANYEEKRQSKPYKGRSYSSFTTQIQSAKTFEDCERVSQILLEYIAEDGPNIKSAIKDLIALYCRKTFSQYDKAIELFEKHEGYYANDKAEKLKMLRLIIPAYIASERYDDAIKHLLNALNLQKDLDHRVLVQDYLKLAYCYLKLENYDMALKYCNYAYKEKIISVADSSAIYSYLFAAYIGKGEYSSAEEVLAEYSQKTTNTDKIQNMRNTLNDLKSGKITAVEAGEQIDEIVSNGDQGFVIPELYTKFLKKKLDECQFSQVRNRVLDEKSNRYTWRPKDIAEAESLYNSLLKDSLQMGVTRPGVLEEAAEMRLNLAKIALTCMELSNDLESMDEHKMELWRNRFIWASASYLWMLFRTNKLKVEHQNDTLIFCLIESIKTYFKDSMYTYRYEFYDSINNLIIYLANSFLHIENSKFEEIKVGKPANLSPKKSPSTYNNEIASLEGIIINNFRIIIESNTDTALIILGVLISNCSSDALKNYYLGLFEEFSGIIIDALTKKYGGIINDNADYNDAMIQYRELLIDERNKVYMMFRSLSENLEKRDWAQIDISLKQLKDEENKLGLTLYSKSEVSRCEEVLSLIKEIHKLVFDNQSFEISQQRILTVKNSAKQKKEEYNTSLSELAFEFLIKLLDLVYKIADSLGEEIIENSMPEITVEDEYSNDGYFPVNDRIDLMLLISNGKSGKQCTTANNICVDIEPDENLLRNCPCNTIHFDFQGLSLGGGDSKSQTIPLQLTIEGLKPDNVFCLPLKVRYQTIRGQEQCVKVTLNIRIKGESEFTEISNLYKKTPLSPGLGTESLFKGRNDDIENICNMLLHGGFGKTILIYGQYRSGKTSLANFLMENLKSRNSQTLAVKAGSVVASDNEKDVINKIVESVMCEMACIGEELSEGLKKFDQPDYKADDENYYNYFTSFAKELNSFNSHRALENKIYVIVLLDEFGRFVANHNSRNFLQLWKSIMEMEAFSAILIGHDIVTRLVSDINALGVINLYQVNYIDRDATEQLITEPTRMPDGRSRFTDNAIEYIWNQSAGNVYYITLICQQTIKYMNKRKINIANELYVEYAIEEWLKMSLEPDFMDYGHPLFLSGEEGSDAITQDEAIKVLDSITKLNNSARLEEIIDRATADHALSEEKVRATVASLRARNVLNQNASDKMFSIRPRLYPDYLNEHIIKYNNAAM